MSEKNRNKLLVEWTATSGTRWRMIDRGDITMDYDDDRFITEYLGTDSLGDDCWKRATIAAGNMIAALVDREP